MKNFIITVDTEGDNLWRYKKGDLIETHNAEYIPRFQSLCERFGFKPVYLTNYEMAQSDMFVSRAKVWMMKGNCEIGVHLHAWNNPPIVELDGPLDGCPYLIEYPENVMREKFKTIYDILCDKFYVKPVVHRAGRWAMNESYFKILKEFGIIVDCSYTPGINWSNAKGVSRGGADYTNVPNKAFSTYDGIVEVPATLRKFRNGNNGSYKHRLKSLLFGEDVWLRPATSSVRAMKRVVEIVERDNVDYLEFMIHSSELMPGGSPYFPTKESVEKEYHDMESFFNYVYERGYRGCTLSEYAQK